MKTKCSVKYLDPRWMKQQGDTTNERVHRFYRSTSTASIVNSIRIRCVGHEVRIGETRNVYRILVKPLYALHYQDKINVIKTDWASNAHGGTRKTKHYVS